MKEIIKMLVVLSVISGVCGFLLASVKMATEERIEEQVLLNVKGPAVAKVLAGSSNDLIKERKNVEVNGQQIVVFVGKKDGGEWAFAFETSSGGYGGDIGVVVGFEKDRDVLTGVGITTHKETPGLGARAKDDPFFTKQFEGKSISSAIKVKKDDGDIDAISGATVSSRAVCEAVQKAIGLMEEIKSKI